MFKKLLDLFKDEELEKKQFCANGKHAWHIPEPYGKHFNKYTCAVCGVIHIEETVSKNEK
jgi:hypothetical protein